MKKTGIHIKAHVSPDNRVSLDYYLNNYLMFHYNMVGKVASKYVKLPIYAEMGQYAEVQANLSVAPTTREALDILKVLEDKGKALYADKSLSRLQERMSKLQDIQEKYGEKLVVCREKYALSS
jgi:DNA repair ATPase RecN